MARIRTIKPDFWTDEKLVELDPWERLLFIGIWNFADDEGFMPYSPKRIKMQVFPGDSLDISRGLQRLISVGALTVYDSENGEVLKVTNWSKHQKVSNPSASKYADLHPAAKSQKARNHAETATEIPITLPIPSESSRGLNTEREREREREVKRTSPAKLDPEEFLDWYFTYPRHEGKGQAERAYTKARRSVSAEVLMAGAERYAADPNRDKAFTKLPATWLNGGCWEDEPLPPKFPTQNNKPIQPKEWQHSDVPAKDW